MKRANWRTVSIENVYLNLFDGPHATPKPSSTGPIFLGIKNISEDGQLDLSEIRHIAEDDFPVWTRRVEPRPGDIVFTYEATLNRYAIVPKGFRGCLGRRLALIRPNHKCIDTKFLFYYFFGEEWRKTIASNIMLGSTVDRIPLVSFPKFPVTLPPLSIQHTIASILSAYDDLIENNTRRIAVLEEMAQMLYEEWFVKFRFPGYEQVRMVEAELGKMLEGWEVAAIGDIIQVLGGGTPSTKIPEYWNDGDIIWFSPTDLTSSATMFISDSAKKITSLGLKESSARLFPAYSVMMTSRATIGVVAINTKAACTNQGFIICIPNERLSAYQIYHWLMGNRQKINSLASGATFKEINRATFKQLQIAIPPENIGKLFDEFVHPIYKHVENLIQRNANLRRTRDILLPKLISGEIDVSSWVGGDAEVAAQELAASVVGAANVYDSIGGIGRKVAEVGPMEPIEKEGLEWHSLWE